MSGSILFAKEVNDYTSNEARQRQRAGGHRREPIVIPVAALRTRSAIKPCVLRFAQGRRLGGCGGGTETVQARKRIGWKTRPPAPGVCSMLAKLNTYAL